MKFINHSDERAIAALKYLAANPRPSGGNEPFNSENLYQIANELQKSIEESRAGKSDEYN